MGTRSQLSVAPMLALRNDHEYEVACDELEAVHRIDPAAAAGRRYEQLATMIDEYELRRRGAHRGHHLVAQRPATQMHLFGR